MGDISGNANPSDHNLFVDLTGAPTQSFPSRRNLRQRSTVSSRRLARAQVIQSTRPRATASEPATASRTKKHKSRLLQELISVGAMLGVGALLIATSLPANALHGASAKAAEPAVAVSAPVETQSLAVDDSVAGATSIRDAYTVVPLAQQARLKFSNKSFAYTNDPNGTVQWPFPYPVPISSGFGPRAAPCSGCSSNHLGIDFTPGAGTPIGAIADGVVSQVSTGGAYGYHVMIDHVINGQKVQSLYAHMLAGSIKVEVGQQVTVKQELGQVGSTGESTGAHLHLEVHIDGVPVDPFAWLKANAN